MNKDIIHKAIESPERSLVSDMEDIEKISSQYPYFSSAQLLLTKAYQRTNDYRYTDQLHQAAVYSSDRKRFYDWIKAKHEKPDTAEEIVTADIPISPEIQQNQDPLFDENLVGVTPPAANKTTDESLENVTQLVNLILNEEPIQAVLPAIEIVEVINKEEELLAHLEVVSIESENMAVEETTIRQVESEHVAAEEEEKEQVETDMVIHASDFDPFEKEILLEAMQSSIELEVSESHEIEIGNDQKPQAKENTEEPTEHGNSFAAWIYNRSRQVHFSENTSAAPADQEPQAVSDWLRPTLEETQEAREEDETEEERPIEEYRNLSHGIKKLTPSSEQSTQQDLIDRFIRLEPKITPGKALEYNAGNLAKESLEEDLSFVTETMAILYAKQGKPDKARKAFKKLMELHPEKSVYFAAQLKNLDKYKK